MCVSVLFQESDESFVDAFDCCGSVVDHASNELDHVLSGFDALVCVLCGEDAAAADDDVFSSAEFVCFFDKV